MQCDIPISNDGGNTEAMTSDLPIAGISKAAGGGKKKTPFKTLTSLFSFSFWTWVLHCKPNLKSNFLFLSYHERKTRQKFIFLQQHLEMKVIKYCFICIFLKHNEASHEGRNSIKSCRRKLYHQDKGKSLIFVMYNFIQFGDITFYKTHTLNEMIFF